MQEFEIAKDEITFINILNVLCHTSKIEEAQRIFASIPSPKIEHFNIIVDTFSRNGKIEDAEKFIFEKMLGNKYDGISPDRVTWTSLLNGCRLFDNEKRLTPRFCSFVFCALLFYRARLCEKKLLEFS